MEIIPKYELFLVRVYFRDESGRMRHNDKLNKGQRDFKENHLYNFLDFEKDGTLFEVESLDKKSYFGKVEFNRTIWANTLNIWQKDGKDFVASFWRPTNKVAACTILQDGFRDIWKFLEEE